MTRRDAVAGELRTRRGDVDVALREALVAPAPPRREQAVVLQLLRELERDARALAELVEDDRLLLLAERGRATALPLRLAGRVELVLDHAQRQELVALQPQDRLQPLEVVLAEEAIAALRPARRQEPLVLEVADLRDRDVGELRREAPHDLADPQELLPRRLRLALNPVTGRARHAMNVIRYLPIWSSSPSSSVALSIRRRLTNVPLSDP